MTIRVANIFRRFALPITFGALYFGSAFQIAARAQTVVGAVPSGQLQQVVVTAERRRGNVQKTAAAISVRAGRDMLLQGRYSLQSILEDVPGITGDAAATTSTSQGGGTDTPVAGLTIRGIPSNNGAAGSITSTAPATSAYVDNVYNGLGSTYDLDRIEILRGPQGTLYGRSATAGVLNITTRDPVLSRYAGDATIEFGNYGLQHYAGAVNVPLGDVLALRVSGNLYQRSGYYNGAGGFTKSSDARVKLLYKPDATFSALLGGAVENNNENTGGEVVTPSSVVSDVHYAFAPVAPGKDHSRQLWATINWDLGPVALTYIPAYRTFAQNASVFATIPGGTNISQSKLTPNDFFSTQELRLASNPGALLAWQSGMLYYDNHLSDFEAIDVLPSGALDNSAATTKSTQAFGIFAQATYPITSDTRLTGGVRYDYTRVDTSEVYTQNVDIVSGSPVNPAISSVLNLTPSEGLRTFNNFTFRLRAEHDLTAQNLVYASVSTGFTPGDVIVADCPVFKPCINTLAPETLTAYEIGSKNRFLDNTLQLNGDVYFYHYHGFQSASVNLTPNLPFPTFTAFSVPLDVAGAELEALYQITPEDRTGLDFSYTDAYYHNKSPQFAEAVAERSPAPFVSGGALGATSPAVVNVTYDHNFTLPLGSALTFHGDVRYLSPRDGDEDAIAAAEGGATYVNIPGQVIGDMALTWQSADTHYSVSGYVRNVGDNRYVNFVQLTSDATPFTFTQNQYDPRTYGMVLNAHF